MRSNSIFVTLIFFILSAAVLVLFAAGCIPSAAAVRTGEPPAAQELVVEQVKVQVDAGTPVLATAETGASQVAPVPDGRSLLEAHCAQCHVVQQLEEIRQPRGAWEQVVAQMEGMGVHLNEAEKSALLDHLAAADEP